MCQTELPLWNKKHHLSQSMSSLSHLGNSKTRIGPPIRLVILILKIIQRTGKRMIEIYSPFTSINLPRIHFFFASLFEAIMSLLPVWTDLKSDVTVILFAWPL